MAKKYATGFPPVVNTNLTDQIQVVQSGVDGDATLQQVQTTVNYQNYLAVDLSLTPDYQITAPVATTIEIDGSDTGPGESTILLPALNQAATWRPGELRMIINSSSNDITINYSNATLAATLPTGRILLCTVSNNLSANGNFVVFTEPFSFDDAFDAAILLLRGQANGLASLDANTRLPYLQLPYRNIVTITGNTTLNASHNASLILVNSASAVTITLPQQSTTALNAGFYCSFKNINTATFTVVKQGSDVLTGNVEGDAGAWMDVTLLSTVSTVNTWSTAGGTSVIPVTYGVSFYDIQASVDAYPVTPQMTETTTFTALERQCDGTSATFNLLQGGLNMNGGTFTVNGTRTVTALTSNNVVAVGDFVKLIATAVTTPKNATLLLRGTVRRS